MTPRTNVKSSAPPGLGRKRAHRPAARRAHLLLAVVLSSWAAAGAQQIPPLEDDNAEIRGFSIPNTRSAHARELRALGHLAAGRWNEAIEDLQILIEAHGAELIPVTQHGTTQTPVHRGATGWAASQLLGLPPEALALYRRRFESRARAALDLARSRSDRQAIIELAQRWPGTESATDAWWSLGDLELELGDLEQARQSWARALERRVAERRGGRIERLEAGRPADWEAALAVFAPPAAALGAAEQRRVQLTLASLAEENPLAEASRLRRTPRGSLRLAGPGEGALGPPGAEGSTWARPFSIPLPHPFAPGDSGNLFPVRVGDLVFVSNSMRLFAINAYSGSLRWASEEPPGWNELSPERRAEFYEGISHRDTMIAPAASEQVVVAALQVPVSDIHNKSFRNIAITTIIPDRRLYAYEALTGRELWNHHPPPGWDGESGTFTDRVSVAGPPVISASRVIVPVHRMYGRIEFYVACYDLVSGEALWTTQLVSGQRELNMFARAEEEFSAPPVRVENDRVVVLTQLGAIAVLDLFSGSILWETLYDQIAPPSRNSFSAARLKNFWRNAPPVVADGVIVATPFDSRDLLGLDLETGETLWSISYSTINLHAGPRRDGVNLLIGADEHTVFLGGWPVMALRSSGGLSREAPRDRAWRYPLGEFEGDESTSARALLLADRVIIPTSAERIEVDRFGGRRLNKAVPWKGGRSGNLLVEDGTLYTLTSQYLDGYFEWDMLLERARRSYDEAGADLQSSAYLAGLIVERSRTELEAGRTTRARDWLLEAEELLLPFTLNDRTAEGVKLQMHELLRMRGRVFIDLADGAAALKALHRAREFAPSVGALCDTLIEEYVFVYGVDSATQLEILDRLEERCASMRLATDALVDPGHPYGWHLEPYVPEPGERSFAESTSVRMWVDLERAGLAADCGDTGQELEALHRLLERWPRELVPDPGQGPEPLGAFATRTIGRRIDEYGRGAYATFEQRAEELLVEARESHQGKLLALVSELYPHSLAAREANDERLQWATEAGDVEQVARIVLSETPEVWAPELAAERELQLMLHLGAVLEGQGNVVFARALYLALAGRSPRSISTSPRHAGRSVAELARTTTDEPPLPEPATAQFSPYLDRYLTLEGGHRFLGRIPPGPRGLAGAQTVLLYERQERGALSLIALSAEGLERASARPLWEYDIPASELPRGWDGRLAFVPGAVIVSSPVGVYALGREDGERRWERDWFAPPGSEIDSLAAEQGVVLVTLRSSGSTATLCALDRVGGLLLWRTEFDAMRYSRQPLIGAGRVVLMPKPRMFLGRILDLFSGRRVVDFELPAKLHSSGAEAAWIEDGLLIVPWFLEGRSEDKNRVVAVDLWSGAMRWSADLGTVAGGRRDLRSIVRSGGRTFLVLRPFGGSAEENVHGIFVELDTRLGATARVGSFELEDDLRLVGIRQESRVELETPVVYLIVRSEASGQLQLQALDLSRRSLSWTQGLGIALDELHSPVLRLQAESADSVALVLSQRESKFGLPLSTLHVLDKRTGLRRRELALDAGLGTSIDIDLRGLGRSLILAGEDMLEVLR